MAFRHRERGQDRLAELDLDVGALGDQQRVVARLGHLGEQRAHLGRRLEEELVAVELEPVLLVDLGAGLHAQQRVVRLGVVLVRVVAVVGGEQRRADRTGRSASASGWSRCCVGEPVVLQLDEEVVAPEDVLEAGRRPRARWPRRPSAALAAPRRRGSRWSR